MALNRAVALAQLHGPQPGLDAIAAIPQHDRLESHYMLHAVIGELHWRLNQHRAAAGNFRRALHLAQVGPEQNYLARMLDRTADASRGASEESSVQSARPGFPETADV